MTIKEEATMMGMIKATALADQASRRTMIGLGTIQADQGMCFVGAAPICARTAGCSHQQGQVCWLPSAQAVC